ncbi:MAG: NADH-quinone oxidoreductase subunit NuoN [Gammaproteobacteria bacterium]|jgi:NADH-quinone oxidoreductase subunit N
MLSYLTVIVPELFVLVMASGILLLDVFLAGKHRSLILGLTQLTLVGAFILTAQMWHMQTGLYFSGHFLFDHLSLVIKLGAFILTFFVFTYAFEYLQQTKLPVGEFYVLGLFSLLGIMVLASAGSLLTVYLGLELLSLPLYALVALSRDSKLASEAAMKYFVMGALASGLLLYGISLLYGITGELGIMEVARGIIAQSGFSQTIAGLGVVFLIVGIAFKFGAVPFHMWIPDVYSGATTAATLFIASSSKLAAFALAARLLFDTAAPLFFEWQNMVLILATLSVVVGNAVALVQTNIRRLLGYSTIGHMGFVFFAFAAGSLPAGLFYIGVYGLMAVASFGAIILLNHAGHEIEDIGDLKGLNKSHPWFAFLILLLMFSLAGVPPLVGFYAKFIVLRELVDVGLTAFAIIGVLMSVVGAFYYLRIVKTMYFDDAKDTSLKINASRATEIIFSVNGLAFLALGLFPGWLLALCYTVG